MKVLTCNVRTSRGEFPDGHLDIAGFLKTVERMTEIGFIDGESHLYGTHIDPRQGQANPEA